MRETDPARSHAEKPHATQLHAEQPCTAQSTSPRFVFGTTQPCDVSQSCTPSQTAPSSQSVTTSYACTPSTSTTRKDDHIRYALQYESTYNSFDDVELVHCSLPKYNLDEIDISTHFAGRDFAVPFYFNAMVGGSDQGTEINAKLAKVAAATGVLMVTGSYSHAVKFGDKRSFSVRRDNPDLLLATNIGADKPYEAALQAIRDLQPIFLQLHLNAMQELLMPEGVRELGRWRENIRQCVAHCLCDAATPIVLKEVGFGMDRQTIEFGLSLGIKTFDISGRGGTNFAFIENQRGGNRDYLNCWGQSTVRSLLNAQPLADRAELLASGGVRNPLDVVKALVLGARGVGIAKRALDLVLDHPLDEAITIIEGWKYDLHLIMCALGVRTVAELRSVPYILHGQCADR